MKPPSNARIIVFQKPFWLIILALIIQDEEKEGAAKEAILPINPKLN